MQRMLLAAFLLISTLLPLRAEDLATHIYITRLSEAGPPEYHLESDSLVFTYKAQSQRFQPRSVAIAFEHEQFATLHDLQYYDERDEEGLLISRVYFYFLPIHEDIADLDLIRYRYIVDGIWIEDPQNPRYMRKLSGMKISEVELPANRIVIPTSPIQIEDNGNGRTRLIRFHYRGEPGQEIFLAGSFNNWDPFMYRMMEQPLNPGYYEIQLRLLPGDYQYNYYYRGRRIPDPLNSRFSYDIEGYTYSLFTVSRP